MRVTDCSLLSPLPRTVTRASVEGPRPQAAAGPPLAGERKGMARRAWAPRPPRSAGSEEDDMDAPLNNSLAPTPPR